MSFDVCGCVSVSLCPSHAGHLRNGRVELPRDLFIWAYERSTQEYLVIHQQLTEPEPLRLQHRCLIKDTVRAVVLHSDGDAQTVLDAPLPADLPEAERHALRALIWDELRLLHEGVLARYGLRPSQLKALQEVQDVKF